MPRVILISYDFCLSLIFWIDMLKALKLLKSRYDVCFVWRCDN